MPEEVFETPQPVQPTEPTVGSKPTNWIKIILVAVLGLALLAGAAYVGYRYSTYTISPSPTSNQQVGDEETIKKLVLENISTFENVENAEVSFDQLEIKGNQAVVDIFIRWGRGLGVGYRQTLTKEDGQWFITSRESTIVE